MNYYNLYFLRHKEPITYTVLILLSMAVAIEHYNVVVIGNCDSSKS